MIHIGYLTLTVHIMPFALYDGCRKGERHYMKRKVMKAVSVIAVIAMLLQPVKVKAIAPELTALLAIPINYPLITAVLVAGGIGTYLYWDSLDPIQKQDLVDDVRTTLNNLGLTMGDKITNSINNSLAYGEYYIRGAIAGDESFVPISVIKAMYDVAKVKGYFGDDKLTAESIDIGLYSTVEQLPQYDAREFVKAILVMAGATTIQFTQIDSIFNVGDKVNFTGYNNGIFSFARYRNPSVLGTSIDYGTYYQTSIVRNTETSSVQIYPDGHPVYGTYYASGLKICKAGADVLAIGSNIGNIILSGLNVPTGEYGRVQENQSGGYVYSPWLQGTGKGVQDLVELGESLTISIDNLGSIIRAWEPSVAYPDNMALDIPESIPVTGDIAGDLTQAYAMEGVYADDIVEIITGEQPVALGGITPFLLPNWLQDRFPFSIPYDMYQMVRHFDEASHSSEAPRLVYDVTISGFPVQLVVDLAPYTYMCVYIKLYLIILEIFGMMHITLMIAGF